MNILQLVKKLKQAGIFLSVQRGDLKVKAAKGVLTPELVQEIRQHKAELLSALSVDEEVTSVPLAPEAEDYPLSMAQESIWALSQDEVGSKAYHMPVVLKLKNGVDKEVLSQALKYIVGRHEILHTAFPENASGEPRQKIEDENLQLEFKDARSYSEEELRMMIETESMKPFQLNVAPLLRSTLLLVNEEEYILLITLHHIIADGISLDIFKEELLICYQAYYEGSIPSLPTLSHQYKDYAVWQKGNTTTSSYKKSVEYWKQKLAGELPVADLKSDLRRPRFKTYNGNKVHYTINSSLYSSIKAFAAENQSSPFPVLIAAIKSLMYRYTGKEDLILGTVVAGREKEEWQNLIGLFLNTLPLRSSVDGSQTFESFVALQQNTLQEALNFQEVPFASLVEMLSQVPDHSRSAIFDIMVIFNEYEANTNALKSLQLEPFENDQRTTAQFDITFSFHAHSQGLNLTIEYNTDLYDEPFIQRFARHLDTMLSSAMEAPMASLDSIEFLTGTEINQLLGDFNHTERPYDLTKTPVDLISESVAQNADKTAIISDNRKLTYRELWEEVKTLSAFLKDRHQAGKGKVIGVQVSRTERLPLTLLSVWYSGAAYLPLDLAYPEERTRYILENSGCDLVITDEWLENYDLEQKGNLQTELPCAGIDELAYVIYTSGSTGKPKGVMISHRNASSFIQWAREEFDQASYDLVYAGTSHCFDLSIFEFFYTWAAGKTIRIIQSGIHIQDYIYHDRNVLINTVPSVVQHLLGEPEFPWSHVNVLNMAGEAVPPRFREVLNYNQIEVRNLYGPSETTTYSTNYRFTDKDQDIPVGKPIANTRVYILDNNHKLVPVGVNGEIFIAGAGLTMGYRNKPELTEERYLPDPFCPGEKMYMTGDLARWDNRGQIHYVGRKDHQVKLRGFRIELGEIEKALELHAQVEKAIAMVIPSDKKGPQLIAWIKTPDEIDVKEIKSFIQQFLPPYMTPDHFQFMEEFPLTPNGKVNRAALTWSEGNQDDQPEELILPGNDLEKKIFGIWKEVLGEAASFGITDSFYEAGGNSLQAARLLSLLKQQIGVGEGIRFVLENNTVEAQARKLSQTDNTIELPIPVAPDRNSYQLTGFQERMWVLAQASGGNEAYLLSGGISISGKLDVPKLEEAFKAVLDRHHLLRARFEENEYGEAEYSIIPTEETSFTLEVLKKPADKERDLAVKETLHTAIDLNTSLPIRALLVQYGEDRFELIYTIHHIVADGWSLKILERDLISSYTRLVPFNDKGLEPLEIQYKDYAAWKAEQADHSTLQFWKEKLAAPIPELTLAGSRPRPSEKSFKGSSKHLTVSEEITSRLKELCVQNGTTLFSGLIGSLQMLLQRLSGQEDILIGTAVAGREHSALQDQVGPYLNTIPLRGKVKDGQPFGEVLTNAMETVHTALEYQHLPFTSMLHLTNVPYSRNRSALFDVMAVLQNQTQTDFGAEGIVESSGLTFKQVDLEEGETSQMDLSFFFIENEGKLKINLVYDISLFDEMVVEQILGRYQDLLQGIVNNPNASATDLITLSDNEISFINNQKQLAGRKTRPKKEKSGSPQTSLEIKISELWNKVLDTNTEFDIEDNFFEMGGNSLHAARLVSLIKRNIGLRQGVRFIFDQPTIKSQAIQIEAEDEAGTEAIEKAPEKKRYPLSAFQERLWIMQSLQEEASQAYHVPGGMRVSGALRADLLEKAFRHLITEQEILRTTFNENEYGEPYQEVKSAEVVQFTMELREVSDEQAIEQIIQEHASEPFDLKSGLPIRALLLKISAEEHILLYCLHHIVCDGWSLKLMEKELMANYLRLVENRGPEEGASLVQFNDYVHWKSSQDLSQAKAYWKYKLNSPLPTFSLPVKTSRPEEKTFKGASSHTIIPEKWVNGLNELCRNNGTTLFTGLLTSLKAVLSHYSGQEDIIIGTAVAGREHPDIQDTIGPFLNTLPIRTTISHREDFIHALQNVKLSVVEAFDFQQVSFAEMLTLTRQSYDASRSPIFDIMAVYQNQQKAGIGGDVKAFAELHGLEIQPLPEDISRTSQMDMSFFFVDQEYGLELILVYNTDVYSQEIIDRLLNIYLKQLEFYITQPERSLDSYEFLSKEELKIRAENLQNSVTGTVNVESQPAPARDFKLSEGSLEEKIHQLWQQVIDEKQQFGLEDNFFQVGGNSLHAARLLSLIKRHIGVNHNVRFVFEYSTIKSQADYINGTSQAATETGIPKTPTQFHYPLSAFQERVYVLSNSKDGGEAYHVPGGLELKGEINKEMLEAGFLHLIERHELLRSVFEENQYGEPVRRVLGTDEIRFKLEECKVSTEEEVGDYISKITVEPFDLASGLPIRVLIVKVSEQHHYLLYCLHHIVSDGWSIKVMEKELMETYTLLRQGKNPAVTPLPIQFQDYLVWKNSQNQEEAAAYWENKLASPLPTLEIPVDHRRPKEKTFNGKTKHLTIPAEASDMLENLCLENNTTLFTGIVSSLRTLLWRYSNQKDIIIGTVISGRTHSDTEDQIGPYLNTLPLRNQINSEATFVENLSEERKVILDAFTNQEYPFVKMLDLPWVEYDSSRSPLFDVMVVYQNQEQAGIGGNVDGFISETGLEITGLDDKGMRTSQMDMSFIFVKQTEGLTLSLVFNTDIYPESFIGRLLDNYLALLQGLTKGSDKPVSKLKMVSEEEAQKQLNFLSGCVTEFPIASVTELFEEQVKHTPDRIAITDENREITYSRFNDEVNQLVGFLKEKGVRPGERVCIQMKRSADMIISAFAVLKCGAAYVPVAIDYPEERKQLIIEDSDCKLIINETLYGSFQNVQGNFSAINPEYSVPADSTAYIIYTSGSTGRPKGVVVSHRNIIPLTRNTNFVNVGEEDVLLQWSSFAFDGAVWDIFATLLNGAKLVMLREDEIASVSSIKAKIEAHNVTLLFITTALFNVIVDTDISTFKSLRKLLFGGELVSMDHVSRAYNHLGSGIIQHMYGPTETTVYTTSYPVNEFKPNSLTIPIGSALSNNTVYILDENLQLVPQGVIGEICIGGDGLTSGYYNDIEKTEQKFIPHPFEPGQKIYKSGDLGRWQENDAISFIGRVDHQVKIRGHRIELSEIEYFLSQIPEIKSLIVVVREDENGEKFLCAYLVAENFDENSVRNSLKRVLPDYMVPDTFMLMEELPINNNGKIDRKRLPDPIRAVKNIVSPSGSAEEALHNIWQSLLGNRQISVTTPFAEMGGHSLKATRLAASIRKEFGVEISLGSLLYTSIREQALSVKQADAAILPEIISYPLQNNYPLSQEQKGVVLADIFQNKGREFSMSGSLVLNGNLHIENFKKAYRTLFNQHDSLKTTFKADENGEIRQWINNVYSDEQIFILKDISQAEDSAAAIREVSNKMFENPLDLQDGPLMRLALIKCNSNKHVVIYYMHHAIADGWSLQLIQENLLLNYAEYSKGTQEFPEKGLQYTDYAIWQEEQLRNGYFTPFETYWQNQFNTKPEFARIVENDEPRVEQGSGWYRHSFDEKLFESIQAKSQKDKLSLFTLSYAAVNLMVYTYSGLGDLTIPSPFAGRFDDSLYRVLGCFADLVLLRVKFDVNGTIDNAIKNAGNTVRGAYQYQAYPLSLMHEFLQDSYKCDIASESRLSVNFLNLDINNPEEEDKILSDTGLTTSAYHEGDFHSKFDLNFVFSVQDDTLQTRIEYNKSLYSSEFIENMAERLNDIFRMMTMEPETTLADLRDVYKSQAIQSVLDGAMMELDDDF
ncbi:amino acid adenylation domain-containing protein [Roseivirga sp. BDSF3-8]|uniref:amino acid adenylation domain-containing protein n=1 Tax=Roseivirga sp. BDSF3-8 TaxID=3241598 RepID=UPI0035319DCA